MTNGLALFYLFAYWSVRQKINRVSEVKYSSVQLCTRR